MQHRFVIAKKPFRFISATEQIKIINASATVLVDITRVEIAQIPRLLWFSVFYVNVVVLIHAAMVRFAGYKKLLFSRQSLEQEVIERTQALEKHKSIGPNRKACHHWPIECGYQS